MGWREARRGSRSSCEYECNLREDVMEGGIMYEYVHDIVGVLEEA